MSGMRRSMITTSGRRRSVSATADAPSAASPMTRMRGERESARRRPSRTTSWSSAMRQVISSATGRFYGAAPACSSSSRSKARAVGGCGCERVGGGSATSRSRARAARTGAVIAFAIVDRGQVRARAEQRLVALDLLGPVARERFEEVLADTRPQVDDTRPDRLARPLRGLRGRRPRAARRVREPGQDRRHADADLDPCVGERADRPRGGSSVAPCPARSSARRARPGWGGRRTRSPAPPRRQRREHVEVADDERTAGDDRERRSRRGQLDEARTGQPEPPLGGLVRIGRGAERDLLALPRRDGRARAASTSATFGLTRIERP